MKKTMSKFPLQLVKNGLFLLKPLKELGYTCQSSGVINTVGDINTNIVISPLGYIYNQSVSQGFCEAHNERWEFSHVMVLIHYMRDKLDSTLVKGAYYDPEGVILAGSTAGDITARYVGKTASGNRRFDLYGCSFAGAAEIPAHKTTLRKPSHAQIKKSLIKEYLPDKDADSIIYDSATDMLFYKNNIIYELGKRKN